MNARVCREALGLHTLLKMNVNDPCTRSWALVEPRRRTVSVHSHGSQKTLSGS
jgi:hypothetical protein